MFSDDLSQRGAPKMDIVKGTLSRKKFLGNPGTVDKPLQQEVSVTIIIVCGLKEKMVSVSPVCRSTFPDSVTSSYLDIIEA